MNRSKSLLLPLYYVSKQTRTRLFTEKGLICIVIFTSVFSIVLIFKNLPTNSHENTSFEKILIPQFDESANKQIVHNNGIEHQKFHKDNLPKIRDFKSRIRNNKEDDKVVSKEEFREELEKQNDDVNEQEPEDQHEDLIEKQAEHEHEDLIEKQAEHEHEDLIEKQPEHEIMKSKESDSKDSEALVEKRNKVKEMTLHAWNGYKKYAWGKNELKPLSKEGHSAGIFGGGGANNLGASIVDALDTLYIMGFEKEFTLGKEWITKNLNLNVDAEYSAFEVNIRFIGGLLSLYTLSGEKVFLDKAEEIAKMFLPIFESPTGIPYALFNPHSNVKRNYHWAAGSCSILAEFGSMSLEWSYLSDLTGKPIYKEKVNNIFKVLAKVEDNGLYYNYINPNSGKWCGRDATLGALADSFYEYLLKLWVYGNKKDNKLLETYLKAMKAARKHLIGKSTNGLTYAGEYANGRLQAKMGHLACFTGGMFALTAMKVDSLSDSERDDFKNLAVEITNTCHESYIKTDTHIGPETFHFNTGREAQSEAGNEKYYILRPEVVEAYFYLWRLTKDNKYREWAWDAVQAIEKHCRTPDGFSGIRDVYSKNPSKDDVQQSFFFAETLKYLYLIFSDDDTMSFDKYVFNTEAHPFLIKKSI